MITHAQHLCLGVDTRGALGAEAPPPQDFQALYYTLYIGMAKIVRLRPKHKIMIVA